MHQRCVIFWIIGTERTCKERILVAVRASKADGVNEPGVSDIGLADAPNNPAEQNIGGINVLKIAEFGCRDPEGAVVNSVAVSGADAADQAVDQIGAGIGRVAEYDGVVDGVLAVDDDEGILRFYGKSSGKGNVRTGHTPGGGV